MSYLSCLCFAGKTSPSSSDCPQPKVICPCEVPVQGSQPHKLPWAARADGRCLGELTKLCSRHPPGTSGL